MVRDEKSKAMKEMDMAFEEFFKGKKRVNVDKVLEEERWADTKQQFMMQ